MRFLFETEALRTAFTRSDDGYIFYPHRWSEGYPVSVEEYEACERMLDDCIGSSSWQLESDLPRLGGRLYALTSIDNYHRICVVPGQDVSEDAMRLYVDESFLPGLSGTAPTRTITY